MWNNYSIWQHLQNRSFPLLDLSNRLVGGVAVYLYVEEVEPDAGRLTKDVDIVVRRNMLGRPDMPPGRRAIHLVFAGEKVRPEDPEPIPEIGFVRRIRELQLVPLPDLVRMKLTSFRLKDQMHLKDMDEAKLITPAVEAGLSPSLRERLAQVRAHP